MKENNTRNTVIGGFFWKFGESLLTQGVSFVISLILARILSPEDYGTVALVTVFINLAAVFIRSGFATALIQKKDADSTDFSTMFYCSLACSVVIYAVLFLAAPFAAKFYKTPALTNIMRVLSLQIPLSVYNSIQSAYVSRHMLFRKIFVSSVINSFVSGAIGIAMALSGFGVWSLVVQTLSGTLVTSFILSFLIPWRPQWKFSKTSARKMMSYGSKLLAADLTSTFFHELRSMVIGRVYSSTDLAFYNKGQQIPALVTNNLSNILVSVMFPAIANQSDDLLQVKQIAKRSIKLLSYILVPCMFGLSVVMKPLILFLFTDKWAQSIPYAQIVCIGLCIGVIGELTVQILKAIGRSDVVLGLEIKKKPIYLLLLVIGVNISVFALAVAVVLYDTVAYFLNMLQLKKHINYGIWEQIKDLAPAFLLGLVMMAVVWVTPEMGHLLLTLVIKVVIGAGFYILASWLFKVESFQYLKKMIAEILCKKN